MPSMSTKNTEWQKKGKQLLYICGKTSAGCVCGCVFVDTLCLWMCLLFVDTHNSTLDKKFCTQKTISSLTAFAKS
jgi:hypothetical protein